MCVALPGQVVEIVDPEHSLVKAEVGEATRVVSVAMIEDEGETVEVGDWLEIHSGHAFSLLDEDEAKEILQHMEELDRAHRRAMDELREQVEDDDPG